MCKRLLLSFALATVSSCFSQPYTIRTVAGQGADNRKALAASLSSISGVAADHAGNVYMSLREHAIVVRLGPDGILTVMAGNGTPGFSGDNGPAILAQLSSPDTLAVDSGGTLYIADALNLNIRKVSNGRITTVASATLPSGLAVDSLGNLYIAQTLSILKLANGVSSVVVGGSGSAFSATGDNVPAAGAFISPQGIAIDSAGNLYFADSCYGKIRKVSNGIITTVAGSGSISGQLFGPQCASAATGGDGRATGVPLNSPHGVATDTGGNVYFVEGGAQNGSRVRRVSNGNISTVAGGGLLL